MRVQGVVNGTVWLVEDVRAEAERWRGYEMGSVVVPGHESCTFGWLLWSKSVGTQTHFPRQQKCYYSRADCLSSKEAGLMEIRPKLWPNLRVVPKGKNGACLGEVSWPYQVPDAFHCRTSSASFLVPV